MNQDQPQPSDNVRQFPAPLKDTTFKSLEDPVIELASVPSVRQILIDSARHNPGAALGALKATQSLPEEQRQPVALTHTLQLAVPAALFLEAADDIKAAAKEALGL